jgi:hypothetical protein
MKTTPARHALAPLVLVLALATAGVGGGCSSQLANIKQQINPAYHTQTLAGADQRRAYDAALAALRQMGYKQTAGGPAQGRIEAISEMLAGAGATQTRRQVAVTIRITTAATATAAGAGTAATIETLFTDIRPDAFNSREGMGSKQPLAESPLYDVFYKYLAQAAAALPSPASSQ